MKDTIRYIKFSGGNNLVFSLIIVILLGIVVFVYDKVSYIFVPLIVILSTIIAPIILAIVTYYLFNPLVNWLEKHKVKRLWGIIVLFLTVIALLTGLMVLIVPVIQEQVTSFVGNFPGYVDTLSKTFNQWSANSIFEPTINSATKWFYGLIRDVPSNIVSHLNTTAGRISSVVSTVSNVAITLIIFPIFLFFLLKDDKEFMKYTVKLIPPKFRKDFTTVIARLMNKLLHILKGN